MDLKQTATGDEPITLAEVKLYSKIDYTTEDSLITNLITAVRQQIEKFTGLSLVVSTYEAYWDYLPEEVTLPYPEQDEVKEVHINGTVSTDYTKKGLTQFKIAPYTTYLIGTSLDNVVQSLYVKYTTLGTCPQLVKNEMLRLLDEKYRNRGNTFVGTTNELTENSYANLAQFCKM